jgi:hypothetical protein
MFTWGGTNLGTPTNFGTTPGAVIAGSVNSSLFVGTTAVSSTAPLPNRTTDGTNPITAAISALGTAPTGTFVEAVNNVNLPSAAAGAALSAATFSAQATAVNIKASAGNLYGFAIIAAAGSLAGFIEFFNTATTATTGAVLSLPIPAAGSLVLSPSQLALLNFSTGIAINVATTIGGVVQITWSGSVFYK